MSFQDDFATQIDGSLDRRDIDVWIAGPDHYGLRGRRRRQAVSECLLQTRGKHDHGDNTRRTPKMSVDVHRPSFQKRDIFQV
jgi:hypothetical protein